MSKLLGAPPTLPPAAAPGLDNDDMGAGGLAALAPGKAAAAGGSAHAATGQAHAVPSAAPRSSGAGGATAAPGAGPVVTPDGDTARVAPEPGPPGLVARTAATPSEPIDDELAALSAEVAASPFSPPATERHAAFLKLVDSAAKAGLQCRFLRCADFSALAAEAGVPMFGDDSVVVGRLRMSQSNALVNQGNEEAKRGPAGRAEARVLQRRSWVVLVTLTQPLLQRRMERGTLLSEAGCRAVEEAYFVYEQQLGRLVQQPVPSAAQLKPAASLVGYMTALEAAHTALSLLPQRLGNADQQERAQAFVLSAVGLIPQTAGIRVTFVVHAEDDLVYIIDKNSDPSRYDPAFWAALLALWRSPAVANVLRSRGALQLGTAAAAASHAEFKARQAADLAKRGGLWRCALPACGKQETTVLQFRVCGHCKRTRYCCEAHAKQHWPAHKREEGGEPSGGGAAA